MNNRITQIKAFDKVYYPALIKESVIVDLEFWLCKLRSKLVYTARRFKII